jgi:TonB family protein
MRIPSAGTGLVLFGLLLTPSARATTGTGGIPTILQQVRIGDVSPIPDTGMTPPIALLHPAPRYTIEALQQGVEGMVRVRAAFDIDGNFEVLEVVEGLGYGLDEAALTALETWRFRPAYRNGRRVPVVASVEVEFRSPRAIRRVVVSIAADERIFINQELADVSTLTEQLRRVVEALPERTVYIEADRRVAFRSVARILDIAREAGIDRIGLVTDFGQ